MVRIARWSSSSRQASSTSCRSEKRRANDVCGIGARDVVLVVTGKQILFSHVIRLKDLKRHLGVEERMIVKYEVRMVSMNFLGVHSGPGRSIYIYVDSERTGLWEPCSQLLG
jgi:hypothetical protein